MTDERLHLTYYSVMHTLVLTRGVPVTMEDPAQETMEQQDSSKERSPCSNRGDICEYYWPEDGVQEMG